MSASPTVTLQFTQAILQAARRQGIALPESVCAQVPDSGRTPLAVQDQLWEAFCAGADDPLAGLRLGLDIQVGHLDLVGMLLMSCETLGEALDLLLEYHPLVGEGGDFALAHQAGDCLLVYEPRYQLRRRERVEAVMACVLNLSRWITGNAFDAKKLLLTSPADDDAGAYSGLLGIPVDFDAPANALVVAPAVLATPLLQANTTMRDHLQPLADSALAQLDRGGFSDEVQALIREHPRWGKERIAEQLGISGRHLVRKLQDEGVTFKLLRSTLLQKLAEEQLVQGASVADVAGLLGFSDESAFIKAFKRWSGLTPAQFRLSISTAE